MRVALLIDAVHEQGVIGKLRAQLDAWTTIRDGQVQMFVLTPSPIVELQSSVTQVVFHSNVERISASKRLTRLVRSFDPHLIHLRYDLFFPSIWKLAGDYPTVIEVNGDDIVELRSRPFPTQLYNSINHRILFHQARGLIAVTEELRLRELNRGYCGLSTVIANGIADSAIKSSAPPTDKKRLVFVGYDRPWHGLDRLKAVAELLPDHEFDIVGVDSEGRWPSNVRFHGVLNAQELDEVVSKAAVGLGAMALDRTGLSEASSLKVRHYLALGLPIVVTRPDPDVKDAWFVCRVEQPEDAATAAARIGEFIERVNGRRVPSASVANAIGVRAKEERRLAFFKDVLRACSPASTNLRS